MLLLHPRVIHGGLIPATKYTLVSRKVPRKVDRVAETGIAAVAVHTGSGFE
jgi:hypothetical protein